MEDVFNYVMNTPANTNPAVLKSELSKSGVGGAAVLYTEQELTEEQKAQARENIGAEGPYFNWKEIQCDYYLTEEENYPRRAYIGVGNFSPIQGYISDNDLRTAWNGFVSTIMANDIGTTSSKVLQNLQYIYTLCENGVFGEDFCVDGAENRTTVLGRIDRTYGYNEPQFIYYIKSYTASGKDYLTVVHYRKGFATQAINYDPRAKSIMAYSYIDYIDARSTDISMSPALAQLPMKSAPTEDMHIATKKYVDDKVSDKELILTSSTENSTKKFKITVDDTGTLTATEVQS